MKLHAKQTQKSWETVTCLLKTPSKRAQEKKSCITQKFHLPLLQGWYKPKPFNNIRCKVRLRGLLEFNFHHHHGKFLIHIYEVQQSCNYNEIPQRVNVQILTYWEKWARDTLHGKTQISAYSVCYSVNHLFGEALHKRKHWCRAAFGKI